MRWKTYVYIAISITRRIPQKTFNSLRANTNLDTASLAHTEPHVTFPARTLRHFRTKVIQASKAHCHTSIFPVKRRLLCNCSSPAWDGSIRSRLRRISGLNRPENGHNGPSGHACALSVNGWKRARPGSRRKLQVVLHF